MDHSTRQQNSTSSNNVSAEAPDLYAQALQSMYEQQFASMAGLTANPAAASMFGYNPFLMSAAASPFAGLAGGFGGLGSASALGGGLAGLGSASDYQAAAAAAAMSANYPSMAALYGMGIPGLPTFSTADYASLMAAYSTLATSSAQAAALTNSLNSMFTSTATSESSGVTSSEKLCSLPSSASSLPKPRSSPHTRSSPSARTGHSKKSDSFSVHNLVNKSTTSKHRTNDSPSSSHNTSSLDQSSSQNKFSLNHHIEGLSAEELDVNQHFKNSLGSLYNTTSSSFSTSRPVSAHQVTSPPGGLDLSLKNSVEKPRVAESENPGKDLRRNISNSPTPAASKPSKSANREHVNNQTRKSVIHSTKQQNHTKLTHETKSPSKQSVSSSKNSNNTDLSQQLLSSTSKQYDALPNLKRLSEQLKTEKPLTTTSAMSSTTTTHESIAVNGLKRSKPKHVVSLLRQNHSAAEPKIRRGKQNPVAKTDSCETTLASSMNSKQAEDQKSDIKSKIESGIKQQQLLLKQQKRARRTNQKNKVRKENEEDPNSGPPKPKRRRKTQDKPRPDAEIILTSPPSPLQVEYNKDGKIKRSYIRTKLAEDKPVDMVKMMVPFEYGWRRETRLRGINKNGRMIGEVFYYTPNDKRMRSFNEVKRFLEADKVKYEKIQLGSINESGVEMDDGSNRKSEANSQEQEGNKDRQKSEKLVIVNGHETHADKENLTNAASTPAQSVEEQQEDKSLDVNVPTTVATQLDKLKSEYRKMILDNDGNSRPPHWEVLQKEHFSFNSKVKVGDFLEQKPGEKYVLLNDEERDQRIRVAQEKRNRQIEKLHRLKMRKPPSNEQPSVKTKSVDQPQETASSRSTEEVTKPTKSQKRKKALTVSKKPKEMKKKRLGMRMTLLSQKTIMAQMKKRKAEEKQRAKLLKEQQARALLEERRRKVMEERMLKIQQRLEKHRMRERQKRSLLNTKLIEARRKEEERRRQQMEKILVKERKQEIKKREFELARELKQPAEDLRLPDVKEIPSLNRIPGMKLPACVFANVLQVHQFISNFYDCLQMKFSIPSLNTFQQAMLNDNDKSIRAVQALVCHLLNFALKDPGIPNPTKFKNELGQKLTGRVVDEMNFSEILRLFILVRENQENELTRELEVKPFSCLSMKLRSEAMVWLCDELNTSQAITEEIDSNMENNLSLRRDKWEIEGKIRELKSAQENHKQTAVKSKDKEYNSDQSDNEDYSVSISIHRDESTSDQNDEKSMSAEDKKLEKLNKQYKKVCKDVQTVANSIRTLPYGADRYHRLYWSLPSFKGLVVESLESSINMLTSGPSDMKLSLDTPKPSPTETSNHAADENQPESMDLDSKENSQEATPPKAKSSDKNKMEVDGPVSVNEEETKMITEHKLEPTITSTPEVKTIIDLKAQSSEPCPTLDTPKPPHRTQSNTPSITVSVLNGSTTATSTHSITSWLNSTIDNIFGASVGMRNSSGVSCNTSSQHNISNPDNLVKSDLTTQHIDTEESWFELKRKLPCDKLTTYSPTLISSSLAFMSCVAGSEEQKELEALEALAKKNALLDQAKSIPIDLQKGWWMINDYEQVKNVISGLHTRGIREKQLNRFLSKNSAHLQDVCSDRSMATEVTFDCDERDSKIAKSVYHAPDVSASLVWSEEECRTAELMVLDRVEDLEERVYQASMYTKQWAEKKRHDATDLQLVITPAEQCPEGDKRIIDLVKEKLLLLESGIEKRYLKPPFIKSTELHIDDIVSSGTGVDGGKGSDSEAEEDSDKEASEETCSKGLLQWQRAVKEAVNLSQLYLSLEQLESCVAWEKSVMRVLCQICRSDDNEDQLLLCDGCDKGYHTYCFKPKMTSIPDGNWYCWECRSKATSVPHCIRCGKSTGKMAQCHKCPQAIHIDCTDPPLTRVPRKHTCGHCLRMSKQSSGRGRRACQTSRKLADIGSSSDDGNNSSADEENGSGSDEEEEVESSAQEILACRELLEEMEKMKEAKHFLHPVDTKAFPQYKKYIKQPMDMSTISSKLAQNKYKRKSEFYDDMILIFENCLLFNEDNSEVGKSGKVMRRQFLKRWKRVSSTSTE